MKRVLVILLLLTSLFYINCKKGDDGVNRSGPSEEGNPIEDIIDDVPKPTLANLVFPENQTECNEGYIIDENWSSVNFKWKASDNTDSYIIRLTTGFNYNEIVESTQDTVLTINIKRGKQYKWYVTSKSNSTDKTSSSDVWSFYNAGAGEQNHAPFPPSLTYPTDGQVLTDRDPYYFKWTATDLDGDVMEYDLFIGSHSDSLNFAETYIETEAFMYSHADQGKLQYWKIHATDSHGSTSISETYSFN